MDNSKPKFRAPRSEASMTKKSGVPGQVMDKEAMTSIVRIEASTLQAHSKTLTELLGDLALLDRPTGDVTFISLDRSKEVLAGMTEVRKSIERIRSAMKARALARMKDG